MGGGDAAPPSEALGHDAEELEHHRSADECGRADLIVARVAAPTWCGGGTVIDPPELLAHGVHWLRWDAGRKAFEVRPAIAALDRLWRIAP